jgi:spore germination protein PE
MFKRISKVDSFKLVSGALGSTIQIGDSNEISGLTRALAVQRQREIFYSFEGDFSLFKIFSYPLTPPPIYEPITIHTTNVNPIIKVGPIDVIAVSSASFVHIGSTEHVQLETRVLHIRQIETVDKPKRSIEVKED